MATIYDFTLTDGKGNQVPLANFKGKVMLIVNTATGCGFTPHYKPIEQMYSDFHDKGFEVIEAKWLFGVRPDQIEVVVHPQSVIHSMVQYEDGAVKAQLGMPDMRLPIQYAFSYPQRIKASFDRLDFSTLKELTFEQPDTNRFRCLALAYEALNQGGNMACIVNAANEIAVSAFLNDRISFLRISGLIEETMNRVAFIQTPSYEDYVATDAEARRVAEELL